MKATRFLAFVITFVSLITVTPVSVARQDQTDESTYLYTEFHQYAREKALRESQQPHAVSPEYDRGFAALVTALVEWDAINAVVAARMKDCGDNACVRKVAGQLHPVVFVYRTLLEKASAAFHAVASEPAEAVAFQKGCQEGISRRIAFYGPLLQSPSRKLAVEMDERIAKDAFPRLPDPPLRKRLMASESFLKALPEEFLSRAIMGAISDATRFNLGDSTLLDGKNLWHVPQDSLLYKWGFRTDDKIEDMGVVFTRKRQGKDFLTIPFIGTTLRIPIGRERTDVTRLPYMKISTDLMRLVVLIWPNERFVVRVHRKGETRLKEVAFDLKGQPELQERLENFAKALALPSLTPDSG